MCLERGASAAAGEARVIATTAPARLLVLGAIVAVAFNLRLGVVSVGPVLDELMIDLSMSSTVAGVLASLPVLAFAAFGSLAPRLARRWGMYRLMQYAVVAVAAGLLLRVCTTSNSSFIALSALAVAGIGVCNVMMPAIVRLYAPGRVAATSALYTTAMAAGVTIASASTYPLMAGLGSWRPALGLWCAFAIVALAAWSRLPVLRGDRGARVVDSPAQPRMRMWRSSLAWAMAGFFGLQSLIFFSLIAWFVQIYRDHGVSAGYAGGLLGLLTLVAIPASFAFSRLASDTRSCRVAVIVLPALYLIGFAGIRFFPLGAAPLWAVLLGLAGGAFPLSLTLIGLRARTPAGAASLSGFTQGLGYLIAVLGPFAVGALYDWRHSWDVSLVLLAAIAVPMLGCGLVVSRPRFIEDGPN
jgi:CP family cyanate transporter-like MFS transporter